LGRAGRAGIAVGCVVGHYDAPIETKEEQLAPDPWAPRSQMGNRSPAVEICDLPPRAHSAREKGRTYTSFLRVSLEEYAATGHRGRMPLATRKLALAGIARRCRAADGRGRIRPAPSRSPRNGRRRLPWYKPAICSPERKGSGGGWPCRSSDGARRSRRRRGPSKFRELPSVLDSKTMLLPIGKIRRVVITERMILLRRSLRECGCEAQCGGN